MFYQVIVCVQVDGADVYREQKIEAWSFNDLLDTIRATYGWNPDIRNISALNYIDHKKL